MEAGFKQTAHIHCHDRDHKAANKPQERLHASGIYRLSALTLTLWSGSSLFCHVGKSLRRSVVEKAVQVAFGRGGGKHCPYGVKREFMASVPNMAEERLS